MQIRRSIILDQKTTSVSMEETFWNELDRLAGNKGRQWHEYLRSLLCSTPPQGNRSGAVKEEILRLVRQEADRCVKEMTCWWNVARAGSQEVKTTRGYRVLVGRDQSCELVINDHEVSRQHALLAWDNSHWWVIDLDSKNGVGVNNRQIAVARLGSEHSFHIGQTTVKMLRYS